jgi:hypothetical protein
MARPVSRWLLPLELCDEADIGARLLAARHARMNVENERDATRNRITSIVNAQKQCIARTAANYAQRDELLRERSHSRIERQQMSELRAASLPTRPDFRESVARARFDQRDAIEQAHAEQLRLRQATAGEVKAGRWDAERTLAELEEERIRRAQLTRDRVVAEREQGEQRRLAARESRRLDARAAIARLRGHETDDDRWLLNKEYDALVCEEESLIRRITRTHEAALEADSELDKLAAVRVSLRPPSRASAFLQPVSPKVGGAKAAVRGPPRPNSQPHRRREEVPYYMVVERTWQS